MRYLLFLVVILVAVRCKPTPETIPSVEHISPAGSGYRYNGSSQVLNGLERHDALATYVVTTTASSLEITAETSYQAPYIQGATISITVDGYPQKPFALVAIPGKQRLVLSLAGTGSHTISLVEGAQYRVAEQGPLFFTTLTGLGVPAGQSISTVFTPTGAEGIEVFGDSRTVGGAESNTGEQAWTAQLRGLRHSDVFVGGYAGLILGHHLVTAAKQDSVTVEINKRLAPYAVKKLWLEAGVNDYQNASFTPAQLTAFYRQWLPKVRQAVPGIQIFLQTDIVKLDESPNKLGFTLPQYRMAEADGAGPDAQVVDGLSLADAADLQDGVHQTAAGDAKIAAKVNSILGPR